MNEENNTKIANGIEMCEDKCSCGGTLRLHTHTFHEGKDKKPRTKHYIDCDKRCGKVSSWKDSIDEAIEEFDSLVSESTCD